METDNAIENLPYDAPMPKFSTPVTIEELRSAFYRYSLVAIVKALQENNKANWNYILRNAAYGDREWIYALTTFVAPGADASSGTEILIALARALPRNPKAVLYKDISSRSPSLHKICTLPFIEPEYEFISSYGERTLDALRQVDDPYLLDTRDLCIRRLQESLAKAEKVYNEGKWNQ